MKYSKRTSKSRRLLIGMIVAAVTTIPTIFWVFLVLWKAYLVRIRRARFSVRALSLREGRERDDRFYSGTFFLVFTPPCFFHVSEEKEKRP